MPKISIARIEEPTTLERDIMKLYFFRHSQTIFEPEVPTPNWVLSEEGIEKAKLLSGDSKIMNIEIFYSSLQNKALETTVILAKPNRTPIKTHSGLAELTSITNAFIPCYDETVRDLYAGKIKTINHGESLKEGRDRFHNTIEDIVHSEVGNDSIGIVTHGSILSLFASEYSGVAAYELHQQISMPDMAILDWETKSFLDFFGE
jgi:broad specificity phosphatase PhoE